MIGKGKDTTIGGYADSILTMYVVNGVGSATASLDIDYTDGSHGYRNLAEVPDTGSAIRRFDDSNKEVYQIDRNGDLG